MKKLVVFVFVCAVGALLGYRLLWKEIVMTKGQHPAGSAKKFLIAFENPESHNFCVIERADTLDEARTIADDIHEGTKTTLKVFTRTEKGYQELYTSPD